MNESMKCESCGKEVSLDKAIVCSVPGVPYSACYCKECLQANSHPMWCLIIQTALAGGLDNCIDEWKEMVMCSLKHQNKTLEWFNAEVKKETEKL